MFSLLDRIFTGFDDRAKKLGVFKVETIGDCYMAATGVPDKVNDHAGESWNRVDSLRIRTIITCMVLFVRNEWRNLLQ